MHPVYPLYCKARAFVASGKQPERNVIFAFWDGEEKGLLWLQIFCANLPFHLSESKAI